MQVHRYQQHLLIIPTRLNTPSWMKLIAELSGFASCEQPYGFRSACNIPKGIFHPDCKVCCYKPLRLYFCLQ